jgi:hypothetical protein
MGRKWTKEQKEKHRTIMKQISLRKKAKNQTVQPAPPTPTVPAEVVNDDTAQFADIEKELAKAQEALGIDKEETTPTPNQVTSQEQPTYVYADGVGMDERVYKDFLEMPFKIAARMTKCKDLALTEGEVNDLARTLKPIGDRYLPAIIKKYGEVIVFVFMFSSVTGNKIMTYLEYAEKQAELKKKEKEAKQGGTTNAAPAQ